MVAAFDAWWSSARSGLAELPESKRLMPLRREMLDSFEPAMLPVGCLDRYALMGSIAGWWDEIRYELRVIVENGFAELVDGWVETLRSALEDEDADDDEDSDAKKTVKVTLEELLAHPFVRHRMADYVTELSAAQAEVERIKAEKEAWETGDGVEGAEDWLDGAEEGSNLAKELEKRRKELRAEMKDDDKRRKELVKTTGTGKPSKGSIDWMRAQGMDVREFEAELAAIERRLAPLVEEAETIDAMLAPYEAIKEELKEARATLRRLKAAFVERLTAARAELDDDDCRELVLDIDRERLLDRLEAARIRRVSAFIVRIECLWDKYRTSLDEIENDRAEATSVFGDFMAELGYSGGTSARIGDITGDTNGELKWPLRPLGALVDLINGFAFKPNDWLNDGTPIIRIQNLNGGQDFNYTKITVPEKYHVNYGDLLFSWSGNRGTSFGPFVWKGPYGYLNQHIFKIIVKEGVSARWLYFALDEVRVRAEKMAHGGSGLVHVKRSDLEGYLVAVPTLSEQEMIADRLEALQKRLRFLREEAEKINALRENLRDDLLTGRVTVEGHRQAAE
ncbi:restriction endonuclease subunit S [Paracoccus sediminilitoris]|uniref:restriction endonuclease subunit S n=1 Tax=Paracoccus sediminilitoris TaxID=2202419 RepID=UPI002D76C503|nr:restriction endonuclease subunit S [Paracoccus sediminilitoris]